MSIDLVEVRGTYYQVGLGHGEQQRNRVAKSAREGMDSLSCRRRVKVREMLVRLKSFMPFFRDHAPHLLEEMQGIADASGLTLEEVLFLNVRHDVQLLEENSKPVTGGCTSFAAGEEATGNKVGLAGQNKDTGPAACDEMFLLSVKPTRGPNLLGLVYPGEVGPIGLGGRGVAVFANALYTRNRLIGCPHNLVRRVLLESASVSDGERTMRCMSRFSSGNYTVADRLGNAACFEVGGEVFARVNGGKGLVVHANHVLHPDLKDLEAFEKRGEESEKRSGRLKELLEKRLGELTVNDCKKFLRDHEYQPQSICRHNGEIKGISLSTTFSLISDLKEKVLYVARGCPCRNQYVPYSV